jgi:uncharacterized protein YjbI with pentapeptide repeats
MKKFYRALLVVITLLTLTGSVALAQGPVGADCTDPPNLVPFADLTNCDLSGREMEGVNLSNANLTGANIDDASLFTTTLDDAIFDNASLRNTIMEDAHAYRASFINADLRGADLYFANFNDANLTGANISNTWLHSFDLPGAIVQNANFSGSNMRFMNMRDTDLRGADLSLAELLYLNLSNADLRDATLLGAERGSGVSLDGVIWGNTTCADGSNSDDNDGDNFTCEGNFPENVPPTITLTSPAQGETFAHGETITISADAADSDGSVSRFEFYADDTFLGYGASVPSSIFDWTDAVAGTHVITVIVFDDDGASASQSVTIEVEAAPNNQPPTVTITSPRNNATVYRWWGTDFEADANDPDGSITKVEFYSGSTLLHTDTSAPYSFWWKPTSRGFHTLTAKAYDDGGADTTSDPVTVRVK